MQRTAGQLDDALAVLQTVIADLSPRCWTAEEALRLLALFAKFERLAHAGKALAARRVEETESWRRSGHRSAAHFLAATTATPVGEAVAVLETARRLEELPATAEAVRAGRLSAAQAREITSAADPTSEGALLEAAQRKTMTELRDHCRRLKASSAEHEERYEQSRYLRHWTDRDGAVRLDARLTPDDGARLIAAVDDHRQKIFADARRAGRREPFEAYAADALAPWPTHLGRVLVVARGPWFTCGSTTPRWSEATPRATRLTTSPASGPFPWPRRACCCGLDPQGHRDQGSRRPQ